KLTESPRVASGRDARRGAIRATAFLAPATLKFDRPNLAEITSRSAQRVPLNAPCVTRKSERSTLDQGLCSNGPYLSCIRAWDEVLTRLCMFERAANRDTAARPASSIVVQDDERALGCGVFRGRLCERAARLPRDTVDARCPPLEQQVKRVRC